MNYRTTGITLSFLFALALSSCTSLYTGQNAAGNNGADTDAANPTSLDGWNDAGTPIAPPTITEDGNTPQHRPWATIYFAYDQSSIGEAERAKLNKISEYLRTNPKFNLLVEGHCDKRGSEEYNRSLGERRAIAVQDYLVRVGLPKDRIHTLSLGEEKPATGGADAQAMQLNRRAELIVISAKNAGQ